MCVGKEGGSCSLVVCYRYHVQPPASPQTTEVVSFANGQRQGIPKQSAQQTPAAEIHVIILIIVLAGPALFHGRLRAFGKCTNGVAFSKGRPNLASVRLTL